MHELKVASPKTAQKFFGNSILTSFFRKKETALKDLTGTSSENDFSKSELQKTPARLTPLSTNNETINNINNTNNYTYSNTTTALNDNPNILINSWRASMPASPNAMLAYGQYTNGVSATSNYSLSVDKNTLGMRSLTIGSSNPNSYKNTTFPSTAASFLNSKKRQYRTTNVRSSKNLSDTNGLPSNGSSSRRTSSNFSTSPEPNALASKPSSRTNTVLSRKSGKSISRPTSTSNAHEIIQSSLSRTSSKSGSKSPPSLVTKSNFGSISSYSNSPKDPLSPVGRIPSTNRKLSMTSSATGPKTRISSTFTTFTGTAPILTTSSTPSSASKAISDLKKDKQEEETTRKASPPSLTTLYHTPPKMPPLGRLASRSSSFTSVQSKNSKASVILQPINRDMSTANINGTNTPKVFSSVDTGLKKTTEKSLSKIDLSSSSASISSSSVHFETVGLKNLGNTCYMNATMQCLFATSSFVRHFKSSKIPKNEKSRIGKELFKLIHGCKPVSVVDLTGFAKKFRDFASHFQLYEQHDAQEFLLFLFMALKEELKPLSSKSNEHFTEPKENDLKGLADKVWRIHAQDDIVSNLFGGIYINTFTCLNCKKQSHAFEYFDILPLHFPTGHQKLNLENLMEHLNKVETVNTTCPSCKSNQATKQIKLWKLGSHLILHLVRFEYSDRLGSRKLTQQVALTDTIDLINWIHSVSPFMYQNLNSSQVSSRKKSIIYEVYGTVQHTGSVHFGHYYAHVKYSDWICKNDALVSNGQLDPLNTYIIFLRAI